MNKLLLTSILGAISFLPISSAPISPDDALGRLSGVRAPLKSPAAAPAKCRLAYTSYSSINNAPAWYAFNNEAGGWLILPADDVAAPLLGYSDAGSFCYDALPEAMKWWLSQYASEISASSAAPAVPYEAPEDSRPVIAPMIRTAWDQNAPFNLLSPEIEGISAPTGCVATAMAQFMKFYDYPAKGTGTLSYSMNGLPLSLDLDALPFEWDSMLDIYRDDATDEQKMAVAQLMQACGYSVESLYYSYVTTASVYLWPTALIQNFGYAPSSQLVSRIYMDYDLWESTIYDSLADGCPVLYSGLGSSGGHAFICDGYQQGGFFHFNWGWAGLSDGYFLLSALNPTALGTGGGAGGFNSGQIALVNCRPDFEGSVMTPQMGLLEGSYITYSNVSKNLSLLGGGIMNLSPVTLSARPGFEIECPDGRLIYAGATNAELEFPVTFVLGTYARKVPENLSDGTYKVRPVFGVTEGDATVWRHAYVPVNMEPCWTLVVEGGKGTIADNLPNVDVEVSDFRLTTGAYSGTQFKMAATIENKGDREFMSDVYVVVYHTDGARAMLSTANPVDLMAGESGDFEFTVVPSGNFKAGQFLAALAVDNPSEAQSIIEISERIPLDVKPFQSTVKLEASEFYVENAEAVNCNNVTLHVTMTCVEGNYASPLRLWIRPSDVTTGTWGQMLQTQHIYLNEGETTSFSYTFEYPKGLPGVTYTLLSNYVIPESQAWFGSCQFTVDPASSVEAPEAVDEAPTRYFNLQGVEVAEPVKGIYIRVSGGKAEKILL